MRRTIIKFAILCFIIDFVGAPTFAQVPAVARNQKESELFPKPFPSTVLGLEAITNSHKVSGTEAKGEIFRGASPEGNIDTLLKYGITHVLIFKNQLPQFSDVTTEIQQLKNQGGFKESQIKHIPFLWKKLPKDSSACEQTIEALSFLRSASLQPNSKVFFHCTVGEDRTGLLAGVYRMLFQGLSMEEAFGSETLSADGTILKNGEMCSRGYEAGNKLKKQEVAEIIQNELTPVFTRVAFLIESGLLKSNHFDGVSQGRVSLESLKNLCRLDLFPYPFYLNEKDERKSEKEISDEDFSQRQRFFDRYNPEKYRCR